MKYSRLLKILALRGKTKFQRKRLERTHEALESHPLLRATLNHHVPKGQVQPLREVDMGRCVVPCVAVRLQVLLETDLRSFVVWLALRVVWYCLDSQTA